MSIVRGDLFFGSVALSTEAQLNEYFILCLCFRERFERRLRRDRIDLHDSLLSALLSSTSRAFLVFFLFSLKHSIECSKCVRNSWNRKIRLKLFSYEYFKQIVLLIIVKIIHLFYLLRET